MTAARVVTALAFAAVLAAGQARAGGGDDPVRSIVFFASALAPEAAEEKTAELERTVGFTADVRYAGALRGFAARLSGEQLAAVRADATVVFVQPEGGLVGVRVGYACAPDVIGRIGALARAHGFTVAGYISNLGIGGFFAELSAAQLAALDRHPDVLFVGPAGPGSPIFFAPIELCSAVYVPAPRYEVRVSAAFRRGLRVVALRFRNSVLPAGETQRYRVCVRGRGPARCATRTLRGSVWDVRRFTVARRVAAVASWSVAGRVVAVRRV